MMRRLSQPRTFARFPRSTACEQLRRACNVAPHARNSAAERRRTCSQCRSITVRLSLSWADRDCSAAHGGDSAAERGRARRRPRGLRVLGSARQDACGPRGRGPGAAVRDRPAAVGAAVRRGPDDVARLCAPARAQRQVCTHAYPCAENSLQVCKISPSCLSPSRLLELHVPGTGGRMFAGYQTTGSGAQCRTLAHMCSFTCRL